MPSLLRSFLAVFVGFMVMIITKVLLTPVLVKTMGAQATNPGAGYLAANAVYSCLAVALGGFATAFVAQNRLMRHAGALAAVIFILGMLSYLHYTGQQPFWYQILMQIIPPLCALAGAALYARNVPDANR
jgi:hypothetical protein